MSDSFSETKTVGLFDQIKESIKGVLTGIVLVFIAFPMLFLNECNAVEEYKALEEGASSVVSVTADKFDKGNNNKLIHSTAEAKVNDTVEDPQFKVSTEGAVKIIRDTEIYQWVEEKTEKTEKKTGGKKEVTTDYTYKEKWVSAPVDSSKFNIKKKHGNSDGKFVEGKTFTAKDVSFGAFKLGPSLIDKFSISEDLSVNKDDAEKIEDEFKDLEVDGGGFYIGNKPNKPDNGDVRVKFRVIKAGTVSVIAKQDSAELVPFKTSNGRTVELLEAGKKTADEMFATAEAGVAMMTWILRFLGLFLMFSGFMLIFKPLVVVADIIPFIGNMLNAGTFVFSAALTFGLGLTTIAISWLIVRPLIGIPLCLCSLGSIIGLVVLGVAATKKKKASAAAAA